MVQTAEQAAVILPECVHMFKRTRICYVRFDLAPAFVEHALPLYAGGLAERYATSSPAFP